MITLQELNEHFHDYSNKYGQIIPKDIVLLQERNYHCSSIQFLSVITFDDESTAFETDWLLINKTLTIFGETKNEYFVLVPTTMGYVTLSKKIVKLIV